MSLSRSRKLSQPSSTHTAINTIHYVVAEPKRPAAFAYLQIHAQVVHSSLSRRSSPPASLGFFQRSRMGSPRLLGKRRRLSRRALTAPSIKLRRSSVVAQCAVVPWEKSKPLHIAFPSDPCRQGRSSVFQMRFLTTGPLMESLKVIAFDKTYVNKDFSSANHLPHIP
jgi:hypothetical protein